MKVLDTHKKVVWSSGSESYQAPFRVPPKATFKADLEATYVAAIKIVGKRVSGDGIVNVYLQNDDGTVAAFKKVKFNKNSSSEISFMCKVSVLGARICLERGKGSVGTIIIDRVIVDGDRASARIPRKISPKESFGETGPKDFITNTRIAVVIPYSMYGGGEVYIEELIKDGREGFGIDAIFMSANHLAEKLADSHVNVICLRSHAELKTRIREGNYDSVVFYNSRKVYESLTALKKSGHIDADIIEIYHSDFEWADSMSSLKVRSNVSKIFRVSEGLANDIANFPDERKICIPVSVDEARFRYNPEASSKRRAVDKPHIGLVARLSPEKNIDYVLSLARLLPSFGFTVVGSGPMKKGLERRKAAESLNNVRFLGHKSDVERYYSEFDGLILTSKMEGSPITIAEGMACGLPIFTTPVGQIPSLYSGLSGVNFLTGDLTSDAEMLSSFDFIGFRGAENNLFALNKHDLKKNRDLFFSNISNDYFSARRPDQEHVLNGEYL